MEPLRQWICDDCGELIEKPENGHVTWQEDENYRTYDIKIVHKGRCVKPGYYDHLPLDSFLGNDGLSRILSMLDYGPIRHGLADSARPDTSNLRELVDFVRRVQIPHYEEARQYFGLTEVQYMDHDVEPYYSYLPDSLLRMIEIGKTAVSK